MDIRFIGQGLELDSNQFGEIIRDELNNTDYTTFNCFVAFLSEGAINRLQRELSNFISRGNEITFYVGIHNGGTSRQALEALIQLGVNAYIFYNNRRNPIYHPKAYIFKNTNNYSLFVGSNNFTTDGFFSNVETAIRVSGSIRDEGQLLNEVELFFGSFLDNTDLNLQPLTEDLLDTLEQQGLIPNQDEYYRSSSATANNSTTQQNEASSLFPSRAIQSPPRRTSAYETTTESSGEVLGDQIISDTSENTGGSTSVNNTEDPSSSNEQNSSTEAVSQRTIWFETRTLTSGSRNQLDLSNSGIGGTMGGIELLNPSRINNLNITIRYLNSDYFPNPIYYPTGGVRPNGSWRLSMRGRTDSGLRFTEHTRDCNLCDSILLFHEIGADHYELEVLPSTELGRLISTSSFSSHGPNNGRYYGEI